MPFVEATLAFARKHQQIIKGYAAGMTWCRWYTCCYTLRLKNTLLILTKVTLAKNNFDFRKQGYNHMSFVRDLDAFTILSLQMKFLRYLFMKNLTTQSYAFYLKKVF